MVNLRPWQTQALAALDSEYQRGVRSVLVQAATGTGKTILFLAWLNENLGPGQRAIILAHRRELIYQPLEKARQFFPDLAARMGIVMAAQDDASADVIVATVQTLNSNGRLSAILSHGAPALYIVDEAHHDTAPSYRVVEDALRAANPDLLKLGITATPTRTDRDGLVATGGRDGPYDCLAFRYPVQQAIRDGALCEFSAYAAGIPISLANIRETAIGWDDQALGDVLNAENVWEIVLAAWRGELESAPDCSDLPTIIFTASVAQAHGGAEFFRRHGIRAGAIDGGTPDEQRDVLLRSFQSGETPVVFNCQVLTEGFDAPSAACCLMVAPTKSPLVWTQKAGRTLRLDPNNPNKHAVIIDFYPIERVGIFAADALGVPKHISDALEKAEEMGVPVKGWSVDRFGRSISIDTDRIVFRMLDLMAKSRLPWSLNGHIAATALSENLIAAIVLPDPERIERAEELRRSGDWNEKREALYTHIKSVRLYRLKKVGRIFRPTLIGKYDTPDETKAIVDEWSDDAQLGCRSASWRRLEVSPGQWRFLAQLRRLMPEGWYVRPADRGEASRLINEALATTTVNAAELKAEHKILRLGP